MWKPICEWLLENYPVVLVVGVIVFVSWKTFAIYNRFTITEGDLKTHISDFKEIKTNTRSINDKLNQLLVYLQARDSKLKGLIQSNSPLQLTDFAIDTLNKYGAYEFIKHNREALLKQVKDTNPSTSLDVQNASINIISLQNDKESFNIIKEMVYNKPVIKSPKDEEIQVDISTLNFIMGIVLRNEYLKENPHVKIVEES
jgi:hypothetical protein